MDDDNTRGQSKEDDLAILDPSRDPTPEEELNQDIGNLSIEESPAGPGVNIQGREVGTVTPDKIEDFFTPNADSRKNIRSHYHDHYKDSANTMHSTADNNLKPDSEVPLRRRSFSFMSAIDKTSDTPFTSATEISDNVQSDSTNDNSSKKTHTANEPPGSYDKNKGTRQITEFFSKGSVSKKAAAPKKAPNICTWNDSIDDVNSTNINTNISTTNNLCPEPLPQRTDSRKRQRNFSDVADDNTSAAHHAAIIKNNAEKRSNDTSQGATKVTNTSTSTDKSVSFSIQGETDEFLPIPAEGLPFFRRARGCLSAEARAISRASHLETLCDAGKPPRWAYGIGPLPPFLTQVATDLVNIRKRHALEFTRNVARTLRDSSLASRRQGNLNLKTVENIYANDGRGYERATTKLMSLVSRDNTAEAEKLRRKEELISRSPTTDDDIICHLKGKNVAARSYAGVVANDPPQPNNNDNGRNNNGDREANRDNQRRRRSRSRSNVRGNQNRAQDRRNTNSRSPNRNQQNRNNQRRDNREAQSGRGNSRRQSRNNPRDRDGAFEFMEKMMSFFNQNR